MRWSGPFYIIIKRNWRLNDNIWFKNQPKGENTISKMMKTIVAGNSLEESHKKLTNHSVGKTTVSKLKKANIERSDIMKVSGHRSVQSPDDYDETNEEEQRRLSSAISKLNYENPSAEKKRMAVSDITTTVAPLAIKHERSRTTHIRDLTIWQRRRPWKRRRKIDFASF